MPTEVSAAVLHDQRSKNHVPKPAQKRILCTIVTLLSGALGAEALGKQLGSAQKLNRDLERTSKLPVEGGDIRYVVFAGVVSSGD